MRKKFSIDAKKVFAFEMTAPLIRNYISSKGRKGEVAGGGGGVGV